MTELVLDNEELQLLQKQLEIARSQNQVAAAVQQQGAPIQIPGIGRKVSAAYEQLRKAAEYTEEHLLLQRALRRFLFRSLSFHQRRNPGKIGEELVVELTQAGYLRNDTYSEKTTRAIEDLVNAHYLSTFWQLREAHVPRETATEWVLDILSVAIEELLSPHYQLNALASYAHYHYAKRLPKVAFLRDTGDEANYDTCLYIAVHKALFASDRAVVRYILLSIHAGSTTDLQAFISFNKTIDQLYVSRLTQRIQHSVSRYGAPLRVLRSMADARPDMPELLNDPHQFMQVYNHHIHNDYKQLRQRINRGMKKSIAFVFVTKVLIGLAIEIPYDLIVTGTIALLPLAINLLFPPLYMASLRLSMHMPTSKSAEALHEYMQHALYMPNSDTTQRLRVKTKKTPLAAKIAYTILFFIPLSITAYILMLLNFNIVQGIIFFIFFSTVSFLGFRLAHMIRDLELASEHHSMLLALRDFYYLPFITIGQWISRKYAKVNIVAYILDIAIELPLKTFLRLLRQWTKFLNEKHDELM
jgi:hypothetical protein